MTAHTDKAIRNKALVYTTAFSISFLLLLLLLKWKLPVFEKETLLPSVEVEVNWPPDPPAPFVDGGGGGGNEASSTIQPGIAANNPPTSGEQQAGKEIAEDANSTSSAVPLSKLKKSKSLAVSGLKIKPQKNIETPSPPKPKALMGKSTNGNLNGATAINEFEKTGGFGKGTGTGNGLGEGGGRGDGLGGGNGSGIGTGTGPRVTKGDRRITKTYSFEGDLNRATLYVNILVSPEGTGKFISFAKGSTTTSAAYRQAIIQYLDKMRFDAADHESTVTVQFNFRIN